MKYIFIEFYFSTLSAFFNYFFGRRSARLTFLLIIFAENIIKSQGMDVENIIF